MEYAIGKILYIRETKKRSIVAEVKVLFYSNNGFWTSSYIEDHFPPSGKVFAPNLPADYPFLKTNDIICFNYVENQYETLRDDADIFIIPSKKDGGDVWKCPLVATDITEDDIFHRVTYSKDKDLIFFTCKQGSKHYICGPVWSNDLSPKTGKEVKAWHYRENYDTIIDPETGKKYLTVKQEEFLQKEHQTIIDCMSISQLMDWWKNKLKTSIDSSVLKNVLSKIKETEEQDEDDKLSKSRFDRIRQGIKNLRFTWEELQNIRGLNGFKEVINSSIQEQLDNVLESERANLELRRKQYQEDFLHHEQEFNERKRNLDREIQKLNSSIDSLKNKYTAEKDKVSAQEKRLKELSEKRNELIEIIKLQADITGGASAGALQASWSYPLEHIVRNPNAKAVGNNNKDAFCNRVNESLELQKEFMCSALQNIKGYDIFKTADIKTGILLANALGNSIYQICQPSPQWISFKDFWNESLSIIWESAHKNPDIWHFLLIENFNIALPECWGMPLWNIISGKATVIPCAMNQKFPHNLRIFVSVAPTESDDNSHLGLLTRIGDEWKSLNPNEPWDKDSCWEKFVANRDDGLVVNEEFFYPVG